METKFKYGDKVKVIKGFYAGLEGKVISLEVHVATWIIPERIYYRVRFNEPDPDQAQFFERSFSDEEYIQKV